MTTAFKSTSRHTEPRLNPIEQPKSLKLRLAYWFIKKGIGKVITPVKVSYARFPEALGMMRKIAELEKKFTVSPKLNHLIKVYVATLNGCAFCVDIAKASVKVKNDFGHEMFEDLLKFEDSNKFNESYKAALAYVDEATRNKHVSNTTFMRLQQHFSEGEIVQITFINAMENFYNLLNTPLNIGSDDLCEIWN